MFSPAIETAANFTRPIHTILRIYGGKTIIPGSGTLFFVNEEGYAVTCKHIIDAMTPAENINQTFLKFKKERDEIQKDGKFKTKLKGVELKYKYNPESVIQMKHTFVDCVDTLSGFTCHLHSKYDLAIIKFNDFNKIFYNGYAKFLKDSSRAKQGVYLCRLGFPFPEFSNFKYNETTDDIEWTTSGQSATPRFPIEGMITRFLADEGKVFGIELSTPGLRGQSGGPLFDTNGVVFGMQFSTKHLHLGFDLIDKEIQVNNKTKRVTDYSFLHLGQCIHADIIKEFLKEKGVKYYEE